ncbi:hypothetical protein [Wielerella bovis]|nr:hypothetical protein [Wielerella bovis]ULJ66623.1 hypothetical protein MIS31_10300 [Wielerella bovis]
MNLIEKFYHLAVKHGWIEPPAEIKNPPKYYQKFQRPCNQHKRRKGKRR